MHKFYFISAYDGRVDYEVFLNGQRLDGRFSTDTARLVTWSDRREVPPQVLADFNAFRAAETDKAIAKFGAEAIDPFRPYTA